MVMTIHNDAQRYRFYVLGIAAPTDYFVIPYGTSHVGSAPNCALYIDDPEIEARHLQVRIYHDSSEVINLSSHRRTLLDDDDMPVGYPLTLRTGSTIRIGLHTLVFEAVPQSWTELDLSEDLQSQNHDIKKVPTWDTIPAGLQQQSVRLYQFLPEIYRTDSKSSIVTFTKRDAFSILPDTFLERFLGLFESVLLPVEWTVDNFDFYLDPNLAPETFLPWLEQWYGFEFDDTWNADQRRMMLRCAPQLFQKKGTIEALECVLRIYSENPDARIEIIDSEADSFKVIAKINQVSPDELSRKQAWMVKLIEMFKPVMAHFDEQKSSIH